jgi:hypothetical protein
LIHFLHVGLTKLQPSHHQEIKKKDQGKITGNPQATQLKALIPALMRRKIDYRTSLLNYRFACRIKHVPFTVRFHAVLDSAASSLKPWLSEFVILG